MKEHTADKIVNKNLHILLISKKEKGLSGIVTCLFMFVIVTILLSFTLEYRIISLTKAELEDGLTVSGLAALIVDAKEYSTTGSVILDEEKSFKAFIDNLIINLDLREDFSARNPVYYHSVSIEQFVVYNVKGNDVTIIRYNEKNKLSEEQHSGMLGQVKAENGTIVEKSSIYIKLGIRLKSTFVDKTVYVDNYLVLQEDKNEG